MPAPDSVSESSFRAARRRDKTAIREAPPLFVRRKALHVFRLSGATILASEPTLNIRADSGCREPNLIQDKAKILPSCSHRQAFGGDHMTCAVLIAILSVPAFLGLCALRQATQQPLPARGSSWQGGADREE